MKNKGKQKGRERKKGGEMRALRIPCVLSRVPLSTTPRTGAHQAPLSMKFSRQEYWSGLPFPSAGDLPDPGIELCSSALQGDSLPSEPLGKPSPM